MLDTKLADDIVAAVDAGFGDQVKLTQDLVRYPSLRGQEHTAQDFLHDQMARRGLTMDRWAIDVDAICIALFNPEKTAIERVASATGLFAPFDPQVMKGDALERTPYLANSLEHLRILELRDTRAPRRSVTSA